MVVAGAGAGDEVTDPLVQGAGPSRPGHAVLGDEEQQLLLALDQRLGAGQQVARDGVQRGGQAQVEVGGRDGGAHPLGPGESELEALEGLPPEARIGTWVFEWYWNQPGVPHVAEFVEAIKKKSGRVPTARTWFGYASTWTCALAANGAKSLKAVDMAKHLQDFHLPPEIALMPDGAFYRKGQNQLIPNLFVGTAQSKGSAPDDLFKVTDVVKGPEAAGTLEESGCKMTWPA